MSISEIYDKIPYDLSGASSKNRFRLEMLWGACKMFDLLENDDFCIVFDYKCDIEIHLNDSLEFYQIKTHKVQSPYTFTTLSKQDKTGKSILGRLYVLKKETSSDVTIKIAIVSNAFFRIGSKTYSDSEKLLFSGVDEKHQESICKTLSNELGIPIDLNNFEFIYTSMNLLSPDNDLRGKIVGSFEKFIGCEPVKPNALYRLVRDTVETKASYEMKSNSYIELISNKGITKAELQGMLERYSSHVDDAVARTEKYIKDSISNPKISRRFKSSLVSITEIYPKSTELINIEKRVADYLKNNEDSIPNTRDEIIAFLYGEFKDGFSLEYSEYDIKVFLLLILFKWEDDKYE